jgi:TolB protein
MKDLIKFAMSLSLFSASLGAEISEIFDLSQEAPALKNIRQITFPSQGFAKAGEAYFSPDGKKIIFQAVPEGQTHYQIYSMDLEEGLPKLISTGKGACTCAYFRPDGKKIIFASSHSDPKSKQANGDQPASGYQRGTNTYAWEFTPYMNIYEANPDGSDLKALTEGPAYHAECAYSSDGSRIVFASNTSGNMNLYSMKADGTDVKPITQTSYGYNGGPFFSPDNSKILFRADYDQPNQLQLFVINPDGSQLTQLTHDQAVNWAPYWHPNGHVIAYTTSLHGHRHYEIYLLNMNTGTRFRLTHHPEFDGLPVFNQAGNKIMWTSKRGEDHTCQLFIADFEMPQILKD